MSDITARLAAHRDDMYSDFAICRDLDAERLNRDPDTEFPFEVDGDALALYKARH